MSTRAERKADASRMFGAIVASLKALKYDESTSLDEYRDAIDGMTKDDREKLNEVRYLLDEMFS